MPILSGYRLLACCLILLAAAFLAFGAVIPGEFIVDDRLWAMPEASRSADAAEILNAMGGWVFRPLQLLFSKAALALLGYNAAALHGLSIGLHGIAGILLFLVLGRLLPQQPTWQRLLATLLFVLHPAGSEAVLWISAMSEVTVLVAMLGTLLLYLRWRDGLTPMRTAALGALFFMACLFKETAIMLPVLVLGHEWLRKESRRELPAPLLLVAIGAPLLFLIIRQFALGSFTGGQHMVINPWRIMELILAHLRFIWLPDAPRFALRPPEVALTSPASMALAVFLLVAMLVAGWRLKAGRGVFLFGLLWGALALWPAYAVAAIGDGFFNGRQAYIASAGVSIMLGALLDGLPAQPRRAAVASLCAVLAWMFYATASNAVIWRSNLEIYRQALSLSPTAEGPAVGIADALLEQGDQEGALEMYAKALPLTSSPQERAAYLYNMASVLGERGKNAESERLLRQVIEIEPQNSAAWVGLGNNAWIDGRLDEAIGHYRKAIEFNPGNLEAVSNLSNLLAASGPAHAEEASALQLRAQAIARQQLKSQGRF